MLLSSAKEANMTRKGANGLGLAESGQPKRGNPVHHKSGLACAVNLRACASMFACVLGMGAMMFAQSLVPAMQAPSPEQNDQGTQPATAAPAQQTPATPGQAPAQTPTQTPTPAQQTPAEPATKAPGAGTLDEVHIAPRKIEEPTKPGRLTGEKAPSESDPTLKTHTKPIKVDVDLVLVPVTVTDPMNRLVTGLEKDNFVVQDGGERQEVRHFSAEDAPISLGVIFDFSGSMAEKMDKAREAVVEFFKTANPDDEFFMVAFGDKPTIISDFTQSVETIQGALLYNAPKGRTALMDGIYLGLAKMREARHTKKALLIISDGGDNHSRYTESEIKSLVKEADVQIYAIGIFSRTTPEEMSGPTTLAEITDVTGGRTFSIDNPNELPDVATKIGIELRNQYVLGYRPKNPAKDGKWRKIKVKLNAPKGLPPLTVYAKTGYYAPSE
jgi:Ca-activated chloride channel homolog